MQNEHKIKLPEFLRPYFWDVFFEDVDIKKNPEFVLKRIIDMGDTKSLKWALSHSSVDEIRKIILKSRDSSRRTANLWTILLDIDHKDIPSLQKPYSRTPFGPSI